MACSRDRFVHSAIIPGRVLHGIRFAAIPMRNMTYYTLSDETMIFIVTVVPGITLAACCIPSEG